MSQQQIPLPDGHLTAEIAGKGREIVLLHGFSFDLRSWEEVFADLSRDHRVLRYDLRGFGRSSDPQGPYDHLDDLQAVIAAAGFDAPVVVGLSLGANIALRHALESQPAPPGIVLISPGLPGHDWQAPRPPDQARAIAQAQGADAARAFWQNHALFDPLRRAGLGHLLEEILGDYRAFHWRVPDPQRPNPPPIPRLGQAPCPVLVLSGQLDLPDYRAIAARLAQELPQAQLTSFPAAGHMLAMEQPQDCAAAIRQFVQSLPAPPSALMRPR